MTVSIPAPRIKLLLAFAPVITAFVGGVSCLLLGCGGGLAESPYAARPGSVLRGDLRGPFDGRVIDGDTGKPLSGAAVVASWAWETSGGIAGPLGEAHQRLLTDADGRYRIATRSATEAPGKLARFTLLVYKRGYLGWRSDRRWEDFSMRGDFSQWGATVRLERFPSDGSHVRHLRYLGAGGPLAGDLSGELQQAADEIGGAATQIGSGSDDRVIDATVLLSADELKAVTSYAGELVIGKLGDLPSTASYDSVHYRATDQPEKFDAALRVFVSREDHAAAEKQYGALAKEYPSVDERNEVGDRSLRAEEGDILAVAALDRARGTVLVFTCGKAQCKDQDTVVALVRRMWARLDKLAAVPVGAKPRRDELKLRRPELP